MDKQDVYNIKTTLEKSYFKECGYKLRETKDGYTLVDPAYGETQLTPSNTKLRFDGHQLTFGEKSNLSRFDIWYHEEAGYKIVNGKPYKNLVLMSEGSYFDEDLGIYGWSTGDKDKNLYICHSMGGSYPSLFKFNKLKPVEPTFKFNPTDGPGKYILTNELECGYKRLTTEKFIKNINGFEVIPDHDYTHDDEPLEEIPILTVWNGLQNSKVTEMDFKDMEIFLTTLCTVDIRGLHGFYNVIKYMDFENFERDPLYRNLSDELLWDQVKTMMFVKPDDIFFDSCFELKKRIEGCRFDYSDPRRTVKFLGERINLKN